MQEISIEETARATLKPRPVVHRQVRQRGCILSAELNNEEAKQARTVELTAHSLYLHKLAESLRTIYADPDGLRRGTPPGKKEDVCDLWLDRIKNDPAEREQAYAS